MVRRAPLTLGISYVALRNAGLAPLGNQRGRLLLRGTFGFFGLSCGYYSVTHLPLAEATVLQYLHPAITALLAAVLGVIVFGEVPTLATLLGAALILGGAILNVHGQKVAAA